MSATSPTQPPQRRRAATEPADHAPPPAVLPVADSAIEALPRGPLAARNDYTRRALRAVLLAIFASAILLTIDGAVGVFSRQFQSGRSLALGGDLRRSLLFLQQFGDLASTLIAWVLVVRLDPAKKFLARNWIAGAAATASVVWLLKILLGRARPGIVFDAPTHTPVSALQFTPPWRTHDLLVADVSGTHAVALHAWEFWHEKAASIWSMPSSHTSSAAAMAVGLTTIYPRLSVLLWPLVVIVGVSRVVFGAHFPSDVVLGAGIGYAIATLAMHQRWGERLTGRLRPA